MNVIELLKNFRREKSRNQSNPDVDKCRDVLSLSIDEFAKRNLAILVRSYLLGEDIYMISNPDCLKDIEGNHVTYLPEEMMAIYNLSKESIMALHRIKKSFGGRILLKDVSSFIHERPSDN